MKCIVAVDKNWGIGKNNGLLFKLKKDMTFFRQMTTNKIVVMGANTFNSFPNGALPNRVNIVLDHLNRKHDGAETFDTLEKLRKRLSELNSDEIFVIGGASVYKLLLDDCDEAYITKVDADGQAEVFFPDLDKNENWTIESESQPQEDNGFQIRFCKYVSKK